MTAAQATILDAIGNTSLLPLRHVVPAVEIIDRQGKPLRVRLIDSEGATVPLTAATLRLRKPKR